MLTTEKKYYKIKEVSDIVGVPISTLRFWEKKFTVISPKRSRGNTRMYTVDDIEKLKMVWFLVKEQGVKLSVAEQQILHNRKNVSKRHEVISRLETIREDLQNLASALDGLMKSHGAISR